MDVKLMKGTRVEVVKFRWTTGDEFKIFSAGCEMDSNGTCKQHASVPFTPQQLPFLNFGSSTSESG